MRIRNQILIRLITGITLGGLFAATAVAIDKPYPGPFVESEQMLFVLIPHTPMQMAAFYEARGFPLAAIERISGTCFVTVHIENRSDDVIWLELENWQFTSDDRSLPRLGRTWWKQQWDDIDLRQASRSTFGWTQLPEVRDLQPDEPVGGNIVFPGSTNTFNLTARFRTGEDKRGSMLEVRLEDITCPDGGELL
jgi:hypothetical protein